MSILSDIGTKIGTAIKSVKDRVTTLEATNNNANLWIKRPLAARKTIDGTVNIDQLGLTYTRNFPHHLSFNGFITGQAVTIANTFHQHQTIFVDDVKITFADQHYVPGEWNHMAFHGVAFNLAAGTHTVRIEALNQKGNWYALSNTDGSVSCMYYQIIPI